MQYLYHYCNTYLHSLDWQLQLRLFKLCFILPFFRNDSPPSGNLVNSVTELHRISPRSAHSVSFRPRKSNTWNVDTVSSFKKNIFYYRGFYVFPIFLTNSGQNLSFKNSDCYIRKVSCLAMVARFLAVRNPWKLSGGFGQRSGKNQKIRKFWSLGKVRNEENWEIMKIPFNRSSHFYHFFFYNIRHF